jgi:dienelactone hydrolase
MCRSHSPVSALAAACAVSASTLASIATGAIKTERVEYVVDGVKLTGTMVYDDASAERRPGVLVCHEWWGANAYAEKRAAMLAELGYVAFALDMYGADASGEPKVTTDPKQASEWAGQLMSDSVVMRKRAAAGLNVLASHKRVDAQRLGAIGYCMGGTVALELARSRAEHTASLRAIVCFHTSTLAAKAPADNANIKGSVLVCHGQDDAFVQAEQIQGFHAQMKAASVDYVFVSYAGALHSFTNPDADTFKIDGVRHQPAADRRSWAAMKSLFVEVFADSR